MEQDDKGKTVKRNAKGQYAPGTYPVATPGRIKAGEVRVPHSTIPFRDSKGRLFKAGAMDHHYQDFLKLRKLLNEALTDEELTETIRELYKLCLPGEHGARIQLDAIRELHDRFFGKPSQQVTVQKTETKTVQHNFDSWPEADLTAMEAILAKHKEEIVIEALPAPRPNE